MKKIVVAVLLSASITVPAYAMEIKDYPRSLSELEYCAKAYMDKDIAVPEGCKPLWVRVAQKAMSK